MKITLLEIYSDKPQYINKDVMGGYGMVFNIGSSFLAKRIERAKKKAVNMPVFSLGYLAAILKKNGHSVDYKYNEIPYGTDLVIAPSSIVDYKYEIEFAEKIKKETGAKVGFFGPFASLFPEFYLERADFVIKGEPERAAEKIKDNFIPQGIVLSEPIADLDKLPFPDWSVFPVKNYSYKPVLRKKPFITILSSRGCAFFCKYCPYKAHYGDLRKRSADSVADELKHLIKNYGIKAVQFRDPIFTADKARAYDIAEKIILNKLDLEWGCETHVNCLDFKLIDKLYEAGLRSLNLGIESSDAEILKNASRRSALKEKEIEIIKYCEKKGINISAFYILGFPEDTARSARRTIEYAKELNTLVAQFFIFTPFPGTEYYKKLKDKIFENDLQNFDGFTPVFHHSNLSPEELQKLKQRAFVSYYFRPRYLFKHFKNLSPTF